MPNGRRLVASPGFTPRPYGLWSVVQDRSADPDKHWRMGVVYDAWCPAASTTYDPCTAVSGVSGVGAVGLPPSKAATSEHSHRAATPFTVFEQIDCAPVGFWQDAQSTVVDMLTRSEMRQAEQAFATGVAGGQFTVFPHLAHPADIIQDGSLLQSGASILTGNPVDVVEAVARLESALAACYDGVGVIHMPAAVLPIACANRLTERSGAQMRTCSGQLVAAGAGYPGTAPDGSTPAAGTVWLYATGAVFGYRSQINAYQPVASMDRSVNTVRMVAERTYLLGWDCCHFAIPVSLGGVWSGAYGSAGI